MYVPTYHPTLPPSASTVLGRLCRKMGVIDSFRYKGEINFWNWVCVSLDICAGGGVVWLYLVFLCVYPSVPPRAGMGTQRVGLGVAGISGSATHAAGV